MVQLDKLNSSGNSAEGIMLRYNWYLRQKTTIMIMMIKENDKEKQHTLFINEKKFVLIYYLFVKEREKVKIKKIDRARFSAD